MHVDLSCCTTKLHKRFHKELQKGSVTSKKVQQTRKESQKNKICSQSQKKYKTVKYRRISLYKRGDIKKNDTTLLQQAHLHNLQPASHLNSVQTSVSDSPSCQNKDINRLKCRFCREAASLVLLLFLKIRNTVENMSKNLELNADLFILQHKNQQFNPHNCSFMTLFGILFVNLPSEMCL